MQIHKSNDDFLDCVLTFDNDVEYRKYRKMCVSLFGDSYSFRFLKMFPDMSWYYSYDLFPMIYLRSESALTMIMLLTNHA